MRQSLSLALALALWACAGYAVEPDSDGARQLQAERRQLDEAVIAQATSRIESGALDDKQLAIALRTRGLARSRMLKFTDALADLSRAVDLDPFNPVYYEDRAIVYLKRREFKHADWDLDMALGLGNRRPVGEREKGRLAFYRGDYELAASHFARLARDAEGKAFVYAVLWLHIAVERGRLERQDPIALAERQLGDGEWPAPIVAMYLGKIEPQAAMAAATSRDPRTALMLRCEAAFYAGQAYLMRQETSSAQEMFQTAVATGVTEFLEYDWSVRELELLAGR